MYGRGGGWGEAEEPCRASRRQTPHDLGSHLCTPPQPRPVTSRAWEPFWGGHRLTAVAAADDDDEPSPPTVINSSLLLP